MLAIVDLTDSRERIFEKFRKHEILISRADIEKTQPVFIMKAHRKYTDFSLLEKIIRKYGKAVFLNNIIPEGLEYLSFKEYVLPLKMLVKTAAEFYKLRPKYGRNLSVGIFDKPACACEEAASLCRFVRCVRVVTDKTETYEKCADRVYKDCGAGMLVSRKRFTANGCGLIIAVDDKCINDIYFGKAVVYRKFSNNNDVSELNECRDSVILPLSDSLEIDRFTLLCALYEECGYRQGGIPLFSGTDIFKEKTNT